MVANGVEILQSINVKSFFTSKIHADFLESLTLHTFD